MERDDTQTVELIDLGSAGVETKGGLVKGEDAAGRQAIGISED